MRSVAYIMIALGIYLLGDAAYDERRGIAEARSPSRNSRPNVVKRAEDPEEFRNLMQYQWLRAPLILCAGFIILGICRRADRLDPFAPDFAGNSALDELDQTLTEQQEKRRRPLE